MQKYRIFLIGLALQQYFSISYVIADAGVIHSPKIDVILGENDATLVVNGRSEKAHEGVAVPQNSILQTGEGTALRVLYSDLSVLIVDQNSKILLTSDTAPIVQLMTGSVHAIIHKTTTPSQSHRFILSTKSATMGVRGTEFVVDAQSAGNANFHTLEGTVEVAKSRQELTQGKGVALHENQMLKVQQSRFMPVEKFNPTQFMQERRSNHPLEQRLNKMDLNRGNIKNDPTRPEAGVKNGDLRPRGKGKFGSAPGVRSGPGNSDGMGNASGGGPGGDKNFDLSKNGSKSGPDGSDKLGGRPAPGMQGGPNLGGSGMSGPGMGGPGMQGGPGAPGGPGMQGGSGGPAGPGGPGGPAGPGAPGGPGAGAPPPPPPPGGGGGGLPPIR